jgi:hypothetical protein
MAYIPANLSLLTQSIGGVGPATWSLTGTDAHASIDAAGYVTNAYAVGLKAGDLVLYYDTDSDVLSSHLVESVSATTGYGELNAGTEIGSTTSGD